LGYPYALEGEVVHGDKRGRVIGFPTANIDVQNEILPAFGVYACEVMRNTKGTVHQAVMNCGYRPTLGQDLRLQVEAHLLDFDDDLYGEKLSFRLRKFIRKEMRFSGFNDLKEQISKDVKAARIFFGASQT
jgi:riboflavin kinase/FMN adenylyltransferase